MLERNTDRLPPLYTPTENCTPGVCPDWEQNPQPFGYGGSAPTRLATRPGLHPFLRPNNTPVYAEPAYGLFILLAADVGVRSLVLRWTSARRCPSPWAQLLREGTQKWARRGACPSFSAIVRPRPRLCRLTFPQPQFQWARGFSTSQPTLVILCPYLIAAVLVGVRWLLVVVSIYTCPVTDGLEPFCTCLSAVCVSSLHVDVIPLPVF